MTQKQHADQSEVGRTTYGLMVNYRNEAMMLKLQLRDRDARIAHLVAERDAAERLLAENIAARVAPDPHFVPKKLTPAAEWLGYKCDACGKRYKRDQDLNGHYTRTNHDC